MISGPSMMAVRIGNQQRLNMTCILNLLGCVALLLLRAVQADPAPAPQLLPEAQPYSPFHAPVGQTKPFFLYKRQSQCPANHNSCSNLNAPDACCLSGTICAKDGGGNIACCPDNYVCTGTLGASGVPSTSSGQTPAVGTGTASSTVQGGFVGTVTVTSTAGVVGSTGNPSSITGSVAGGGSTVPNAFFPFVFLPTSFANAAICSSYYTSCQAESTACFNSLAGTNGVTVNGLGGGTTQAGSPGTLQASASSICSSLSQSACYGLQSSQCARIGASGGSGSGFVQAAQGPRETGRPAMVYLAAVGAAAGLAGMM